MAKPFCSNGPRPAPRLPDSVLADPQRHRAILSTHNKWLNGTVIHYCFFTNGHFSVPKVQADAIRNAFQAWKAIGIALDFKEVTQLSEAEVRIGYSETDGSSASAVGRDVLNIPVNEPTTVYGWDLRSHYGAGTALHELGHVLGMEHEHQNPYAGIKWHEEAVYKSLGGPPNNWSRAKTYQNILQKISIQDVQGSNWDPDSIMEYEFESGLIDEPEKYDLEGLVPPATLSAVDKKLVLQWYPGAVPAPPGGLKPFESVAVDLAAGQQVDFTFQPTESRRYKIATFGASDTLLALFEDVNGTPRFVAADDDSGQDYNASIRHKLFAGRKYHVRLRLYYPGQTGKTSVMVT